MIAAKNLRERLRVRPRARDGVKGAHRHEIERNARRMTARTMAVEADVLRIEPERPGGFRVRPASPQISGRRGTRKRA